MTKGPLNDASVMETFISDWNTAWLLICAAEARSKQHGT
jgi:hypothetical protein